MRLENKKFLLFDLDGTLIDSVPDLIDSVNYTLDKIGLSKFDDDIIRSWVGNGAAILVQRALSGDINIDDNLDQNLYKKALDIFMEHYSKNLSNHTVVYDGVKETLEKLIEDGYILAIVTNKPDQFVQEILEDVDLLKYFTIYIGAGVTKKRKPDPQPLLYVVDKLGTKIENCVMVGDSSNDIIAAKKIDMDSIGVTYGYNHSQDISTYNPTIVVDHFKDILKYL